MHPGRATAGQQLRADQEIVLRQRPRFVSGGGEKLAHALERFGVDPTGMTVLDVGASTGGFTDCVLQNGAVRVYAVDAGRSQLHSRLVADERVLSMESTNAREPIHLPSSVDLIVADVSFISLGSVLPAVFTHLRPGTRDHFLYELARDWPELLGHYRELYRAGPYLTDAAQAPALRRVAELRRAFDLTGPRGAPIEPPPPPRQLRLAEMTLTAAVA